MQKSMVLWCLWWLNGIPGKIYRWRFMSTGAKHQKKALSTRLQGNDTHKLLSKALRCLLLPEKTWFSLEFVSDPCVQLIKFVCRCPKDYIDSSSCLHLKWQEVEEYELTWYDKWKNQMHRCVALTLISCSPLGILTVLRPEVKWMDDIWFC